MIKFSAAIQSVKVLFALSLIAASVLPLSTESAIAGAYDDFIGCYRADPNVAGRLLADLSRSRTRACRTYVAWR